MDRKYCVSLRKSAPPEFEAGDLLVLDPDVAVGPGHWAVKMVEGKPSTIIQPKSKREAQDCCRIAWRLRPPDQTERG